MSLINVNSLSLTIENVNDRLLKHRLLNEKEKDKVLNYIISRHAKKGSYLKMFAPTEKDYMNNIKLFTGEVLTTRASKAHILSEECCKLIRDFNGKNKEASKVLHESMKSLRQAVEYSKSLNKYNDGTYCCAKCSAAYWRNLASDLKKNRSELSAGLKYLKSMRDGKGKWNKFPYYYTLYSLNSINLPQAMEELEYSKPYIIKLASLKWGKDKYSHRRKLIIDHILDKLK